MFQQTFSEFICAYNIFIKTRHHLYFFSFFKFSDAAGSSFLEYATTHAALGIWDRTNGLKFTIEFVPDNFVGALLPVLNNGYIFWNNSGSVVVTNPVNQDEWVNSRHVSSSNGVAYADLVNYLNQNSLQFNIYQPVTVIETTEEDLVNGTYSHSVIISPLNSYWFVHLLIQTLAGFGCYTDTFIQVYLYLSCKFINI
jgi:hypothetical protein